MKKLLKKKYYDVKLVVKKMLYNPDNFFSVAFDKRAERNGIILVTHEALALGASILLLNIAKSLVAQGERVYIISLNFGELMREYRKVAPTQLCLTRAALNSTIEKLAVEYGYSRILVNTAVSAKCVPIAKKWGYEVVSLIHELGYVVEIMNVVNDTKIMIEESDVTVFSTSIAKDEVLKMTNPSKGRCLIRPQGIYLNKPSDEIIIKNREEFLRRYPSWVNKQLVVGVGNLTYRKGYDIFLDVAELCPDVYFLWAGAIDNNYNEILKDRNNYIPENVFYLGKLQSDELSAIYSMASLMLVSSRHDTLPSTVLEALTFSVPVIGSKESGGIVDVINNDIGFLTEKSDPKEFEMAIRYMLNENINREARSNIEKLGDFTDYSFDNYVTFLKNLFPNQ